MLILLTAALIVAVVPAVGGRFRRLARLHFHHPELVLAALLTQVLIISVISSGPEWLWRAVHLATYAAVALFFYLNRRIPWLWLVAVGGALNLLAILANGGVMPATRQALRAAGRADEGAEFTNSTALAHPRLIWLGDRFSTPRSLPFANVFSIGDLTILIALVLLTVAVTRRDATDSIISPGNTVDALEPAALMTEDRAR